MIKSKYVNVFEDAESNLGLLVHGVTGAMDIVGGELLKWFRHEGEAPLPSPASLERLERRGYAWNPARGDEQAYFASLSMAIHRRRIETTINSFWVIPTYKCNLRCYYCFQEHTLHEGRGIGEKDMTPAEASQLIDAFDAIGGAGPRANEGKGRYITLFGGEPLMEATYETVATIVSKGRAKKYRIGAVTNGVALTRFEDLLGPDKIRWIQITLDGLDAMNDKRRFPIHGSGFDKIVQGITMALERGAQVSLRTNADKRLAGEVQELERWAEAKGWTARENFSWYMTPVETHSNPSLERVTIPMQELIDTVALKGRGRISVPYRGKYLRLLDSLSKEGIGNHVETSSCGAHTKMYFFDPHGLIYACAELVGRPDKAVGKIVSNEIAIDGEKASLWVSRHVGNMPVCSTCPNAFFCGGGCANAAELETGNFFGPRCNGIKTAFQSVGKEYLRKVVADLRTSGVDTESLTMHHLNGDDIIRNERSSFDDLAPST